MTINIRLHDGWQIITNSYTYEHFREILKANAGMGTVIELNRTPDAWANAGAPTRATVRLSSIAMVTECPE